MRSFRVYASILAVLVATVFVVLLLLPQRDITPVTVGQTAVSGARISYPADHYPVLTLPNGERRPVRSMLNEQRPMRFGDYLWNDAGVPKGPVWVRIDLTRQTLSLFRAGHEIGSAVILFGTDGKPTPLGIFPVLAKAKAHRSSLYDAEMPFMLRLTGDGVAVHASNVREGSATHGCIGVPIDFASLLYDQMQLGDRVVIVRS